MPVFQGATYAASVAEPGGAWPQSVAEIAFAGRSNAGKSSAINTLAGQRRLAFVSKTPGRTQLINFFALAGARFLVDLPGYGFANAPHEVRARWDALIGSYLAQRAPLKGLALVMDIRHPLTELDHHLLEFFSPTGKPVHVLLTKSDKLSGSAARARLREVEDALGKLSSAYSAQLFSNLKRIGIEEAEAKFSAWLGLPSARAAAGGSNKKPRAKGG